MYHNDGLLLCDDDNIMLDDDGLLYHSFHSPMFGVLVPEPCEGLATLSTTI